MCNKLKVCAFDYMLRLNQAGTADKITVTLNEKRTLDAGYYLFRFIHIETRAVINKIYSFLDDDSAFQDRYNEFEINTATLFLNQPVGTWRYEVYEQASAVNTDPTGLTQVEKGLMEIIKTTPFAFENYDPQTSYKAYAG